MKSKYHLEWSQTSDKSSYQALSFVAWKKRRKKMFISVQMIIFSIKKSKYKLPGSIGSQNSGFTFKDNSAQNLCRNSVCFFSDLILKIKCGFMKTSIVFLIICMSLSSWENNKDKTTLSKHLFCFSHFDFLD